MIIGALQPAASHEARCNNGEVMPDEKANPLPPAESPTVPVEQPVVAGVPATTPPVSAAGPPSPARIPAAPKPRVKPSGQITNEAGHIPLTEEFDRAKWTLPPVGVVLIALGVVAVVLAAWSWFGRAKPVASGGINDVGAVAVDQNSVLVAIQFTMYNTTDKPIWIKEMSAKVKTDQGELSDTAASASDFQRYFQGFPDLRLHAGDPMLVETKIPPGGRQQGTIIVGFPINKDAFDKRQSLSVIVTPYDQRNVVITKAGGTT